MTPDFPQGDPFDAVNSFPGNGQMFVDLREASAESEAKLVRVMQTAAVEGFKSTRAHKSTKKIPVKDAAGNVTYESCE